MSGTQSNMLSGSTRERVSSLADVLRAARSWRTTSGQRRSDESANATKRPSITPNRSVTQEGGVGWNQTRAAFEERNFSPIHMYSSPIIGLVRSIGLKSAGTPVSPYRTPAALR